MTVLIDELEAHLHPRWQRSVISALLGLKPYPDQELHIQFFAALHSPLILASAEPVFDEARDRLFHIDTDDGTNPQVVLKAVPFVRHGSEGRFPFSYLREMAPFIAYELERQGLKDQIDN